MSTITTGEIKRKFVKFGKVFGGDDKQPVLFYRRDLAYAPYVPTLEDIGGWFNPDVEALKVLSASVAFRKPLLLAGESGVGKTSLVMYYCWKTRTPLIRINLDESLQRADFVGYYEIEGNKTVFREGLLLKAMQLPGILLLDEIDACPSGVLFLIQSLLESSTTTGVFVPELGKNVVPVEGFTIVATANSIGSRNIYQRQAMDLATLDRFCVWKLNLTEDKIRSAIDEYSKIKEYAFPEEVLDGIKKFYITVSGSEDIRTPMTLRHIFNFMDFLSVGVVFPKILLSPFQNNIGELQRASVVLHDIFGNTFKNFEVREEYEAEDEA